MRFSISRAGLLAAAALLFAVPATAQQPMPQQQTPALPDSVQALLTEARQIQQRLDSIQGEALQAHPELVERQQVIQDTVEAVMLKLDPELEQAGLRMDELRSEAATAQQTQDMQKLQQLMMEGQQLQKRFEDARAQALEQENVAQQVEAFRDELVLAMNEVDPQAGSLIDQLESLAKRLDAAMGS